MAVLGFVSAEFFNKDALFLINSGLGGPSVLFSLKRRTFESAHCNTNTGQKGEWRTGVLRVHAQRLTPHSSTEDQRRGRGLTDC